MPMRRSAWICLLASGAVWAAAASAPAVGAEAVDAQAAYAQARRYSGLTGEVVDWGLAQRYLLQAAQAGHREAQLDLAFLHFNGNGQVPRDLTSAWHWFQVAASGGAVRARCMLGDFYANGWGGAPRDDAQAFHWYRWSAAQTHACASEAKFSLYKAYSKGMGTRRDMKVAITWLQRAAESGNPGAQRALGRAYLQGDGVPRNGELADFWLRKAREGVAPHDDHVHGPSDGDHDEVGQALQKRPGARR